VEVVKLMQKKVVVFEVMEYPIKPISFKNKYYKRVLNSIHKKSLKKKPKTTKNKYVNSWFNNVCCALLTL